MRIDLTSVPAQLDAGNPPVQAQPAQVTPTDRVDLQNQAAAEQRPTQATAQAKPAQSAQPNQLSVTLDDKQNVIYRFTDPTTGQVVRQVPPEEILRIMRNIEDMMHESEQKLKVTL